MTKKATYPMNDRAAYGGKAAAKHRRLVDAGLEEVEREEASGYVGKPARKLSISTAAVNALAAVFGLKR